MLDMNRRRALQLATANTPRPAGTVLLLHANDSAADATGTYSPTWTGTAAYATGKFGKAFDVSSGNYVHAGTTIGFSNYQNFTIAGWFKFNNLSGFGGIAAGTTTSFRNLTGYALYTCDTAVQFRVYYYESMPLGISGGTLVVGQWHHIAVTRSSGTIRIFINGISVASGTLNDSILGGVNFRIGASQLVDSYYRMDGVVDEFIVVKNAALWTSNFTPPTKPYA